MVARRAAAFDDSTVAQLLATALSRDGKATARLAQVFDTIAPDEERKRRVLTMARSMLSEQDFGKSGQFRAVWSSMETLLLTYDETAYVSDAYQATLEGATARGEMLAARELPPELPEWIESLEQDNVRALSVMLITDLLRIEENRDRAAEIVGEHHAKVCAPEAIRFPPGEKADGILQLVVLPAHAPLIQHVIPEIMDRVNRFFGYKAVARVKLRQGAVKPPPAQPRPGGPPSLKPIPMDLGEGLRDIGDPELRKVLESLARSVAGQEETNE